MGAISAGSIRRSEAQLRPKRPRVETTDPIAFVVPPFSSAPSTSAAGGVTLEAIMAQLQQMEADFGGRLDYFTLEICQINTWVSRITRKQARMVGYASSPSPSPEASHDDVVDDDEDEADSSGDDKMTTFQWLALCHSWQKGGSSFGLRVVLYIEGELV